MKHGHGEKQCTHSHTALTHCTHRSKQHYKQIAPKEWST
jgi:hypothetical protein